MEKLRQNFRRKEISGLRIFSGPDYSEKYVFFPLHFEPETATMVMAPMYLDQINLIQNMAKSLPINYKLYVKEHPFMVLLGMRAPDYYKKLQKIPNVVLIKPEIKSEEIIMNAELVITITGTAGFEAVLLKKPVIAFGRVFYNKLDMVRKCSDISSLPKTIADVLDGYKHDENELIDFLGAILQASFEIRLSEMYGQGQAELLPFEKVLNHPDLPVLIKEFLGYCK